MANRAQDILFSIRADNKEISAKLDDLNKKIDETGKRTEKATAQMGAGFGRVGTYIKGVLTTLTIRMFANLAGEVDSVAQSFDSLASGAKNGSQALLKAIKDASQGTVSNLEIMRSANEAIKLMGDDVAEKLPKMMEIARITARSSGVEVSKMFSDLITASGRQSVLILDNLGISSATASRYMDQYAASLGKTRNQMTDTERAQAFFHASLKAGEELIAKTGATTLSLGERLQRLKARISDTASSFARDLVPGLEELSDTLTSSASGDIADSIIGQLGNFISRAIIGLTALIEWIRHLPDIFENMANQVIWQLERLSLKFGIAAGRLWGQDTGRLETALRNSGAMRPESTEGYRAYQERMGALQEKYNQILSGEYRKTKGGGYRPPTRGGAAAAEIGTPDEKLEGMVKKASEAAEAGDILALSKAYRELEQSGKMSAAALNEFRETKNMVLIEAKEQEYAVGALGDAFKGLEDVTKNALHEMLWGGDGFKNFGKQVLNIIKQLITEVIFLTVKMIALRAIMASMGGIGGGGFATKLIGSIFTEGRIPNFATGRIPAYPIGRVPADHFPAFIGYEEAVLKASSTRANVDILKWMNDNPGQRYQGGGVFSFTIPVTIDGREVGRAVDTYRDETARNSGLNNYHRRSNYR